MCAIAGIFRLPSNDEIVEKMIKTMRRRGPDGYGCYQNKDSTLLHTRLAIIDPAHGAQPMTCCYGGSSYTISYNGELYNTPELRKELQRLGHCFVTQTDTEVVLHAYIQWKEEALQYLNGIFAFAIWDAEEEKLFLARDRMGVKPLFYKLHNDGLLFASEIKTILAYPTVRAELSREGVADILLLGPGRLPGSGVFKDIWELEPGCFAVYQHGSFQKKRYWYLRDGEHADSFAETVEKVRYLVLDAIRRQMVSDVPLGTFLSGGLDSSIICAVCREKFAEKGLDCFSVDYLNNDKYFKADKFQPNSDDYFIRIMVDYLKVRHHTTILDSKTLLASLEAATLARDLPGMADVDFSLLVFCKDIRKHIKVALSGECADEIFGGYPWYRDPAVRDADGFPWAQNTAYRSSFLHPSILSDREAKEYVHSCYETTINSSDILPENSPLEKRMKQMVNLNQQWFMQTLLDRKDRMSMYHGLEVRVPFCDYRIAEYLYTVPWEYKDYQGREKGLLRKAMEGVLPQEVLYRKKSPYPKTHDPAYMLLVSKELQKLLKNKNAPIHQLIQRNALEELLTGNAQWPWYGQLMRTPQTIAYMLQINVWLEKYAINLV